MLKPFLLVEQDGIVVVLIFRDLHKLRSIANVWLGVDIVDLIFLFCIAAGYHGVI